MLRSAIISPCLRYRYRLSRHWGEGPRMLWIMLNPSTADGSTDDPTLRRCIGFAKSLGFGRLDVVNLFALRSPAPAALWEADDPRGPLCDSHITAALADADIVVAAWGAEGGATSRAAEVACRIAASGKPLFCLGTTDRGHPRHPLYVPYEAELEPLTAIPGS